MFIARYNVFTNLLVHYEFLFVSIKNKSIENTSKYNNSKYTVILID